MSEVSEPVLLDDGETDISEQFGATPVKVPQRARQSQASTGFGADASAGAPGATNGSFMVSSPLGSGSRTTSFGQVDGAGVRHTDVSQTALHSTSGGAERGDGSQGALRSQHTSTLPALNPPAQVLFGSGVRAARQEQEHLPPLPNLLQNTGRSGNALQSPLVTQRPGVKLAYSDKEARLRQNLELQVKKNNLLTQMGKKQALALKSALSEFESRLSQEKEQTRAAELTLIERAHVELQYLDYRDRILAILKEGSRQPLKDENKESVAQRKRQALEKLRATFAELGLDEKGESSRFSTRNEKYVALKDPLTPELIEARGRANEWAHELDVPVHLDFDDKTMSTVRKYVVPPQAVHDVIVAFFLLLGEQEADTRNWKYCRKLLNPYGVSPGAAAASSQEHQGGLREKIDRFDSSTVEKEVAAMAKEILEPYSLAEICKVSECVGPFYLWSQTVIEQLEQNGQLAQLKTPSETNADPAIIQAAKDELAQKNPAIMDPQPDAATLRRVWRSRRQRVLLEGIRARFNILNENTLSQLRVYKAPPAPVHETLQAFFLLLGEVEDFTSNWKNVRKLLEPVPKDIQTKPTKVQKGALRPKSWLERKLDSFQVEEVNGEIAAMAKEILDLYSLDRVRKLNEAAVPFYLWTRKVLSDIEAVNRMATLPPQDMINDPDGSARYAKLKARQIAILRPKLSGQGNIVN